MPIYEYRCLECDAQFDQRRSMAEADLGVACPSGHAQVKRLLPMFASTRSGGSAGPASAPMPSSGGGCGSACACH